MRLSISNTPVHHKHVVEFFIDQLLIEPSSETLINPSYSEIFNGDNLSLIKRLPEDLRLKSDSRNDRINFYRPLLCQAILKKLASNKKKLLEDNYHQSISFFISLISRSNIYSVLSSVSMSSKGSIMSLIDGFERRILSQETKLINKMNRLISEFYFSDFTTTFANFVRSKVQLNYFESTFMQALLNMFQSDHSPDRDRLISILNSNVNTFKSLSHQCDGLLKKSTITDSDASSFIKNTVTISLTALRDLSLTEDAHLARPEVKHALQLFTWINEQCNLFIRSFTTSMRTILARRLFIKLKHINYREPKDQDPDFFHVTNIFYNDHKKLLKNSCHVYSLNDFYDWITPRLQAVTVQYAESIKAFKPRRQFYQSILSCDNYKHRLSEILWLSYRNFPDPDSLLFEDKIKEKIKSFASPKPVEIELVPMPPKASSPTMSR